MPPGWHLWVDSLHDLIETTLTEWPVFQNGRAGLVEFLKETEGAGKSRYDHIVKDLNNIDQVISNANHGWSKLASFDFRSASQEEVENHVKRLDKQLELLDEIRLFFREPKDLLFFKTEEEASEALKASKPSAQGFRR